MPTTTVAELKRSISVCLRQVKAGEGFAKAGIHDHRTLINHTRRDTPPWLSHPTNRAARVSIPFKSRHYKSGQIIFLNTTRANIRF